MLNQKFRQPAFQRIRAENVREKDYKKKMTALRLSDTH